MSTIVLDEIDLEILEHLLKDARTTLSIIAERVQVSVPTISSRLDKLQELNIITRLTIDLNMDLLSEHPSYFILVQTEPQAVETCIEMFSKYPIIREINELLHSSQLLIQTSFISLSDFYQLMQKLRQISGVKTIEGWPISQSHKVNPLSIPKKEIKVRISCEYCGKTIGQDYRTVVQNDKNHFLCCNTCVIAFKRDHNITPVNLAVT